MRDEMDRHGCGQRVSDIGEPESKRMSRSSSYARTGFSHKVKSKASEGEDDESSEI